mmetsp:Transcript_6331/g.12562  ORF Transcript_6331/g.12562 Transcript_6331/m.12562 type:complete len:83 (+) Transcript_6331:629-877(+)
MCPSLHSLDLSENLITTEGMDEFVDLLRPSSLPSLEELFTAEQFRNSCRRVRNVWRERMEILRDRAHTEGKLSGVNDFAKRF